MVASIANWIRSASSRREDGEKSAKYFKKLASLVDVANNTIIKIEAGKNQNPTLNTLKKVVKALEVSVDGILN